MMPLALKRFVAITKSGNVKQLEKDFKSGCKPTPTLITQIMNPGFFKENVRYPVWICWDPISLILGT